MFEGGAQGRTFLVEHDLTLKMFVLKIVSYYTKEQKERADMEIAQMQRLESPFTVRLICTFQRDLDMCMILEYCERGDLRKVIIDLQKLPEGERVQNVWELLAQIGLSLNHLHSNDVVHRDIKPENIFIMEDGSSRLGDFGLVKELADKSYGTAVGTKPYMAPEVFMFQ
ncbi:MAG: putative nek4 protein, partial [Streblomastix strix]